MIWNIKCRRTRRFLALWAGSDLEQRECQAAERHLAVCPGCREVWGRLQQSQQVLERVRPALVEEREPVASVWPSSIGPSSIGPGAIGSSSVWPEVSRHIRLMDGRFKDERGVMSNWRDWLPAGAVAAACLGIIMASLPEVPMFESVSPSVIISSPATFGSNPRHLRPLPLGLRRAGDQDRNERPATRDADDPSSF